MAFSKDEKTNIVTSLQAAMQVASRASRAATEKGLTSVSTAYNEQGTKLLQLIAKVETEIKAS